MLRVAALFAAVALAIATTGCTNRSQFEGDWVCEGQTTAKYTAFRVTPDSAYHVVYLEGGEGRGAASMASQAIVPFKRPRADVLENDGSSLARSTNAIVPDFPVSSSMKLERDGEELHVSHVSLEGAEIQQPRLSWVCKPLDTSIIDEVQSSVALIDQTRPQMQALLRDPDFVACLRIDPSKADQCAVAKRGACAEFSQGGDSLENSIMALAFGANSTLARICTGSTFHLPSLGFAADLTDNQFDQKLESAFRADASQGSEDGLVADANPIPPGASVGSTSAQAQASGDFENEAQQSGALLQPDRTPVATSPQGTSEPEGFWRLATINDPDGFTNVRSEPKGSAPIVGRVLEGQRFSVEPSTEDWWRVKVDGLGEGYMHRSRIALDRSGQSSVPAVSFGNIYDALTALSAHPSYTGVSVSDFVRIDASRGLAELDASTQMMLPSGSVDTLILYTENNAGTPFLTVERFDGVRWRDVSASVLPGYVNEGGSNFYLDQAGEAVVLRSISSKQAWRYSMGRFVEDK